MNNTRKMASIMPEIVKLINTIGNAGKNEIYEITMENMGEENYSIYMTAHDGPGGDYRYYDYDLIIKCADNRELEIKTEAYEPTEENKHGYTTKITTIFSLPKNKKGSFSMSIYGWNYNNLINIDYKNYLDNMKQEVMEENNIIENIPRNYKSTLFTPLELDNLIDRLNTEVKILIEKKKMDNANVKNVLNTLSQDEIKVLKKILIRN